MPPTAAEGCSAAGELQRRDGGRVVHHAGDVGGEVHDVGQVQHERRLGHVHRRAVRLERVGDRADGVLVLLEVLRAARQGRGERQVAIVVAGAPDGAGQHARGDQAALAAHQQLGGRAEQAVDVERPAHRVRRRQPPQRPPDVDRLVGGGHQVAGEDDLLQVAGVDPRDGVGDDRHPLLAVERPVGEAARRPGRPARAATSTSWGAGRSRPPAETVVSQARVAAAADHDLGHHQHGVAGLVGEAEAAEADQAGAGLGDLVAHHGPGGGLAPPLVGVGEAGRPVGRRTEAATPQPTRPSPRRTHATGCSVGSRSTSAVAVVEIQGDGPDDQGARRGVVSRDGASRHEFELLDRLRHGTPDGGPPHVVSRAMSEPTGPAPSSRPFRRGDAARAGRGGGRDRGWPWRSSRRPTTTLDLPDTLSGGLPRTDDAQRR